MNSGICHVIVAAGSGSRFGGSLPKQFCMLGSRPVLMETIGRMRRAGGDLLLVISSDMEDMWRDMCLRHSFESPVTVAGGSTRWESVRNALAHPLALNASVITVHDGARPLPDTDLIDRVTSIPDGVDGNIPVIAVTDSLRRCRADGSSEAVDRSLYRAVQTPQAFRGDSLRKAYSLPYSPKFTDDASVMEAAGFTRLQMVEGNPRNIKITRPGDIDIALIYLNSAE